MDASILDQAIWNHNLNHAIVYAYMQEACCLAGRLALLAMLQQLLYTSKKARQPGKLCALLSFQHDIRHCLALIVHLCMVAEG
eukprot:1148773-Pelagomonas_calceolata.AAC.4